MSDTSAAVLLGAAALVVVGSGVALARAGRPYKTALLSAHKLVAIAALVLIGVLVADAARLAPLSRVAVVATGVIAALNVASVVTGGVVSATRTSHAPLVWAHRLLGWIAVLVSAWWTLLFIG